MKMFISYSSLDRPIAKKIAEALVDNCLNIWLDEWEIKVGESITQKIQEGLEEAKYVCVLLSKNSLESGWVEKEWQSKIGIEAQTRNVHVLPLLIEDCNIPILLRDKKYADFRSDFQSGMKGLLSIFEKKIEISRIPTKNSNRKTLITILIISTVISLIFGIIASNMNDNNVPFNIAYISGFVAVVTFLGFILSLVISSLRER